MLWDVTAALAVVIAFALTFPSEWIDRLQNCWSRTETPGCVLFLYQRILHYKSRFDLILTVIRAPSGTRHGLVSDNGFMSHCGVCAI